MICCDICNTEFEHEFKLKIHRREEHNINKKEKISKCKKSETVPRPTKKHKKTVSAPRLTNKPTKKLRTCYFCEFTCFHPSDMKNHRESTHAGEKYHCTECGRSAEFRKT